MARPNHGYLYTAEFFPSSWLPPARRAHSNHPRGQKKGPWENPGALSSSKNPGDPYFRTFKHYHRLGKLNYCVRDGNRCGLSDNFTGKQLERR